MMKEKELQLQGGILKYAQEEERILITGWRGSGSVLELPEKIDGLPVKGIYKKAFFDSRQLRQVVLAETVEEIGDWAFAHCPRLQIVEMPHKKVLFGKSVFLECPKLTEIRFIEWRRMENPWQAQTGASYEQLGVLLAAAVNMLDAFYLFDPNQVGSPEWFEKWDARMLTLLHLDDQDGYTNQILCGEEDYGSTDLGKFIREKRKFKIRIAMLRLRHPAFLKNTVEEELKDYLLSHNKGCESDETWEVLLEEHGHEQNFFQFFADLGGIQDDNFDALLADMREEHAEMKAFLMRYREEKMVRHDFFDSLSLDF